MGEDIPPEAPSTCAEDCCDDLPGILSGSIIVPGVGTFTGIITQDPVDSCAFSGMLSTNGANTPLFATFCEGVTHDLEMASAGPILAQCGGVIIVNNHCFYPSSKVSVGGCTYQVG